VTPHSQVKATNKDGHSIATFGGGCFWGIELAYQRVPGVIETSVGAFSVLGF
jgi:peptide methionine sulfoxide reductase MsrA